jgi:hypothetical protein
MNGVTMALTVKLDDLSRNGDPALQQQRRIV